MSKIACSNRAPKKNTKTFMRRKDTIEGMSLKNVILFIILIQLKIIIRNV